MFAQAYEQKRVLSTLQRARPPTLFSLRAFPFFLSQVSLCEEDPRAWWMVDGGGAVCFGPVSRGPSIKSPKEGRPTIDSFLCACTRGLLEEPKLLVVLQLTRTWHVAHAPGNTQMHTRTPRIFTEKPRKGELLASFRILSTYRPPSGRSNADRRPAGEQQMRRRRNLLSIDRESSISRLYFCTFEFGGEE